MRARRSLINSSPDTVENTLRALIKANRFVQDKNNQPAVLASLRKWLRLSPNEGGEESYERMRILYDRRIIPSREGIQNAVRVLSKADPKFAKLKPDDLIDDRIVRRLEQKACLKRSRDDSAANKCPNQAAEQSSLGREQISSKGFGMIRPNREQRVMQ